MKAPHLGELEKQVMEIVWERQHCSARDVLTKLQKNRKLAYTTVATILQRLYDKELLKKIEDKAGYVYFPKVSKESYSRHIAQMFLRKFINSFGDAAIASFAESIDKLPERKRKHFLEILEKHDKSK